MPHNLDPQRGAGADRDTIDGDTIRLRRGLWRSRGRSTRLPSSNAARSAKARRMCSSRSQGRAYCRPERGCRNISSGRLPAGRTARTAAPGLRELQELDRVEVVHVSADRLCVPIGGRFVPRELLSASVVVKRPDRPVVHAPCGRPGDDMNS